MIETLAKTLIDELGSTGLLLCGLYFILMRVGRMIAVHLGVINHNTTSLSKSVNLIAQKHCSK